ncbi:trypsin-like peptidase domain-containing protein [Candidatus Nomurabacteria bacterium]|nr:trypsin-like peptidase domain-containing protein [Candidatus Nomurabacteria bacterium]
MKNKLYFYFVKIHKKLISFLRNFKKIGKNKTLKMFFVSFLTMILTVFILFLVIWNNKDRIVNSLINNYIAKTNIINQKPILIEKVEEAPISLIKEEIKKEGPSVISAVKTAKPAVVSIIISKEVPGIEITYQKDGVIEKKQTDPTIKQVGSASGFLVSSDGLIVTNRHVVDKTDLKYTVMLNNDTREYTAKILAQDPVLDVAIIKIEGKKLPYLKLSDSDKLEVGESVVAIGNALGEFKNTVSAGVISGLSRSLSASGGGGFKEFLYKVIQTDAAINKGNSGGPLLNLNGEVVGINVALAEDSSGIGFSLPINSVKSVIDQVKKTGKISRPYVGIRYIVVTDIVKKDLNLPVAYGVLIQKGNNDNEPAVILGSPAEKAGLAEGDIILSVDGELVNNMNDFMSLIRSKKVGEKVTLIINSKGVERVVTLKLGEAENL